MSYLRSFDRLALCHSASVISPDQPQVCYDFHSRSRGSGSGDDGHRMVNDLFGGRVYFHRMPQLNDHDDYTIDFYIMEPLPPGIH
ncbi:hypothetical protein ACEPAG_3938 [Sanghuangporus baumii]